MAASIGGYGDVYSATVRPMLDLVEDLHQYLQGGRVETSLPAIVVVGNQSSGKSSVLERLCRVSLPRAEGLCTRVPLMLSMKRSSRDHISMSYQAASGDWKDIRDIEPASITDCILKATVAIAGHGKDIIDSVIKLRVEGPRVDDLTLIDLPGIVYSPKKGQPKNIQQTVRELILKYIKPEETLILCVFSGDVDLETQQALAVARKADPRGERTLGVITKLDELVRRNPDNARNIVMQQGDSDMGVRLGFTGVRNRTSDELGEAFEMAETKELQLIKSAEALKDVNPNMLGIRTFWTKLCNLQAEHLQKVLPGIGHKLDAERNEALNDLRKFRGSRSPQESLQIIFRTAQELQMEFGNSARGNYEGAGKAVPSSCRIVPLLDTCLQSYSSELQKHKPDVFTPDSVKKIKKLLKETSGHALPNFLNSEAFHTLMQRWHSSYTQITLQMLEQASSRIKAAAINLTRTILGDRTKLNSYFNPLVKKLVQQRLDLVGEDVRLLLEKEKHVVYTMNNYYTVTLQKLRSLMAKETGQTEETAEEKCVELLADGEDTEDKARSMFKELVKRSRSHVVADHNALELQVSAFCYDKVVRKRLVDGVMQSLRYFVVNYIQADLGQDLVKDVSEQRAHLILKADIAEEQERGRLEKKISACDKALRRIEEAGCIVPHQHPDDAQLLDESHQSTKRRRLEQGEIVYTDEEWRQWENDQGCNEQEDWQEQQEEDHQGEQEEEEEEK